MRRGEAGALSFVCICSCWVNEAVNARRRPRALPYDPRRTPIVACDPNQFLLPTLSLVLPITTQIHTIRKLTSNGRAREITTDRSTDAENRAASEGLRFPTLNISRPEAHSMVQQSITEDTESAAARDARRRESFERESAFKEQEMALKRQTTYESKLDERYDATTGKYNTFVETDTSMGSRGTTARTKASPLPDTSSGKSGRQ